jgi:hypothetical protein
MVVLVVVLVTQEHQAELETLVVTPQQKVSTVAILELEELQVLVVVQQVLELRSVLEVQEIHHIAIGLA